MWPVTNSNTISMRHVACHHLIHYVYKTFDLSPTQTLYLWDMWPVTTSYTTSIRHLTCHRNKSFQTANFVANDAPRYWIEHICALRLSVLNRQLYVLGHEAETCDLSSPLRLSGMCPIAPTTLYLRHVNYNQNYVYVTCDLSLRPHL